MLFNRVCQRPSQPSPPFKWYSVLPLRYRFKKCSSKFNSTPILAWVSSLDDFLIWTRFFVFEHEAFGCSLICTAYESESSPNIGSSMILRAIPTPVKKKMNITGEKWKNRICYFEPIYNTRDREVWAPTLDGIPFFPSLNVFFLKNAWQPKQPLRWRKHSPIIESLLWELNSSTWTLQ